MKYGLNLSRRFWLDHLGVTSTTLIGHSLGGLTAFLVTSRRSDLVARLVVADADPDADPGAPAAVKTPST
jgi:pimeloyl-ACP methyl ester carboxylesterase